jgi:NAD(P)-dependent dehydrogenase (short-subunit alcohol dehydrogenase family)
LIQKLITLITGGSKGIGLETVLRLLAQNVAIDATEKGVKVSVAAPGGTWTPR